MGNEIPKEYLIPIDQRQPGDDWVCVYCHRYRGLAQFGTPCSGCGGYSMSSFQALQVRPHYADQFLGARIMRPPRPGTM